MREYIDISQYVLRRRMGKFDNELDAYIYDVSLDGGCDDEVGSCSTIGRWYGLMRNGTTVFRDHDPFCESLTDDERRLLQDSDGGVILTECDHGFFSAFYYVDTEGIDAAWSRIVDDVAELEKWIED